MKFDWVVTNPPYDGDTYLSFIDSGDKASKQGVVGITPIKFIQLESKENSNFRKSILPKMGNIHYFPDETDLFEIKCSGGVAWYIVDKKEHLLKDLTVSCEKNNRFSSNDKGFKVRDNFYGSNVNDLIAKLGEYQQLRVTRDMRERYKVMFTHLYNSGGMLNNRGVCRVSSMPYIQEHEEFRNNETVCLHSFATMEQAESLISYIKTKTVRFLLLIGRGSMHFASDHSWRYVPDQYEWDHVFTDKELYEKYRFNDKEIEFIENTITEM